MEIHVNYKKRLLSYDGISFFCIFGRDGVTENKIEGDWKTPTGTFPIRKIYYRNDRIEKLETKIESTPISQDDIWCDDSQTPEYNTITKLPFSGSHENLWRDDELYDMVIVIGYNDKPAIPNKGSAIFIHLIKENMQYTKGCIAIKKEDMLSLIKKITPETKIEISE